MMLQWKKITLGAGLCLLLVFSGIWVGFADDEPEIDPFTRQVMEWTEQGIDPNHTEAIDAILHYVREEMKEESFASLHIDREERELGVIVLSFVQEIDASHKQAIEELAQDPAEVQFRIVQFTEEELQAKQAELDVDFERFNEYGITIYHTGVDVIGNQVEIGISPYTADNAAIIYASFGEEMLHVVEGYEIHLLADMFADDAEAGQAETIIAMEEEEKEPNFFQRIIAALKNFFTNLF